MTTLVTGATGFLGTRLVRHLSSCGEQVVALGRNEQKLKALEAPGIVTLQLDLAASVNSEQSIKKYAQQVDTVIHCAALSSPWGRYRDFFAANVTGTRTALDIAQQLQANRFIHISTPSIYFQLQDQDRVPENHPLPVPINHYAKTKRMAEEMVMQTTGIESVILRPRGLYGRGDVALLPRLINAASRGPLPLMRNGAAATDLTYIDDVVSAIVAARDCGSLSECEVFNISGGEALPIQTVVNQACGAAGVDVRWKTLPHRVVLAYARGAEAVARLIPVLGEPRVTTYSAGLFAYRQTLDITRAADKLNWQPKIGFDEGLARTFASHED